MALITARPHIDSQTRVARDEADPVLADWRAYLAALDHPQQELLWDGVRTVLRNHEAGVLTSDEADALLKQIVSAAVGATVSDALARYALPLSPREEPWRLLRHLTYRRPEGR